MSILKHVAVKTKKKIKKKLRKFEKPKNPKKPKISKTQKPGQKSKNPITQKPKLTSPGQNLYKIFFAEILGFQNNFHTCNKSHTRNCVQFVACNF
jgi:hypothetical protein